MLARADRDIREFPGATLGDLLAELGLMPSTQPAETYPGVEVLVGVIIVVPDDQPRVDRKAMRGLVRAARYAKEYKYDPYAPLDDEIDRLAAAEGDEIDLYEAYLDDNEPTIGDEIDRLAANIEALAADPVEDEEPDFDHEFGSDSTLTEILRDMLGDEPPATRRETRRTEREQADELADLFRGVLPPGIKVTVGPVAPHEPDPLDELPYWGA